MLLALLVFSMLIRQKLILAVRVSNPTQLVLYIFLNVNPFILSKKVTDPVPTYSLMECVA